MRQPLVVIRLVHHVRQQRGTVALAPPNRIGPYQREKPMRLRRLIRSHLLNKIKYLGEPTRLNASPEEVGESLFIGPNAGWKPQGNARAPLHGMCRSAVKCSTCI
jgi:hypothetical protein